MPQTRRIMTRLTDGSITMKKLVLAALLATFAASASAADKINFGVSATYPPLESLDASNQIVGFDIDLAKALCK
ncbi:transporter substrate-binding domain-containing protein, partial [Enterobacteriaceae bacterium TzEc013]|nr:transporter substrate-binding domain-containing protein [Enterobacteriaceae bacterium TzEc013]